MANQHVDGLDKLVTFLAKRDGIDKLVKTFQYVGKLMHLYAQHRHPDVADRFKKLELASGIARKAFRSGRFLTGFNCLRKTTYPDWKVCGLAILANAGEMIYFFFDHITFFSRVGFLNPALAPRSCFYSAFGEGFGYIFAMMADSIFISRGLSEERRVRDKIRQLEREDPGNPSSTEMHKARARISQLRMDRVMRLCSIAACAADLIIAINDVEPNPFVSHPLTLGVSGLVSAWAGWYRLWPGV
ncbi:hypothetical protein CBR_g40763 [Chara braunii]|uniref:Peroxisomal membrane protein 11B n=1 Tax=Chara braunii TaxID=69332 RepID=A0A388LUL7_CHABU|nr:hypothetical protein CBR_g40763 [Chara braunii]|eukprot:GBG85951.1 hypothetical protein CBR_g40763 [Chara braunii]